MSINPRLAVHATTHSPDASPLASESVTGEFRVLDGEVWYRIANVDRMAPFFMSLISSEDHWMYLASNGALTCGRRDANLAIFPYYSADKLLDLVESAGPKTIIRVEQSGQPVYWEPFTGQGREFDVRRTLYKNRLGSRVLFEETNLSLGLTFRYQWSCSRRFGFIRSVDLINLEATPQKLTILDGLQNILPPGLDQNFQLRFSNLADAYKRSELLPESSLGLYYLNSVPTDRAEPSEGLRTTVAWQTGLDAPLILLSNRQVARFLRNGSLQQETEVRGERQAFLVTKSLELGGRDLCSWRIAVDIGCDHSRVLDLASTITGETDLPQELEREQAENDRALGQFAASLDGLQSGNDTRRTTRHLANTFFNAMRGGLPVSGNRFRKSEFLSYLTARNRLVAVRLAERLAELPEELDYSTIRSFAQNTADSDLIRLATEFLPLTFGRRHGDPTRPWNQFKIAGRNQAGERQIGFEGNWRDIFQNWEALGLAFPELLPGMVSRFVNASTADGYNPYRVNELGFDWERPDPTDPWANIGYWGDHQIVYLHKLLKHYSAIWPGNLSQALFADDCVYAELPYRISGYEQLRANPRETIAYCGDVERQLSKRVEACGTDGQLAVDRTGEIHRVSLAEKLLLTGLTKLANLIPGAGIWLNTQRPEWNDAQNALAGFGASVVTVCYLRNYLEYLRALVAESFPFAFPISQEVAELTRALHRTVTDQSLMQDCVADSRSRDQVVSQLQRAAEHHREAIYSGFTGRKQELSRTVILELLDAGLRVLTDTLQQSRRADGLYHSFNLLHPGKGTIEVEHLELMLEGQVAILESGLLSPENVVELLTALRSSPLYRADQQSYLLYPDRTLPSFLTKNRIPSSLLSPQGGSSAEVRRAELVHSLVGSGDDAPIRRDRNGDYRFAGTLRNFEDFRRLLQGRFVFTAATVNAAAHTGESPSEIGGDGSSLQISSRDLELLEEVWECTFRHRRYLGRSTSFFAYEGLGSIYWHMVSKLAYAVARQCHEADRHGSAQFSRLREQFRDIYEGMWLHKSPEAYGAFPTDPYSHTPAHAGVQQPGMTGQVKEDLLTRLLELGVSIEEGKLCFHPVLLNREEFLEMGCKWTVADSTGGMQELRLADKSLAFTFCQTPIVYRLCSSPPEITIEYFNGRLERRAGSELTREESVHVFSRTGTIRKIEFAFSHPPGSAV